MSVSNPAIRFEPRTGGGPRTASIKQTISGVTETVRLAQAGDQAAFERIYREHVERVYAICLRLSADAVRARELTQDVFVRAWEKLPSFRGESALASWLHRIAVNLALVGYRTQRRRESRLVPTDDVEAHWTAPTPPAGLKLDLEAAIATLPPGARSVFVLHDIEGYRHDEIAVMTGMAPGTSKAHLFRARRLLREVLER